MTLFPSSRTDIRSGKGRLTIRCRRRINMPIGHSDESLCSYVGRLRMACVVHSALAWIKVKRIIPFGAPVMQRAHGPIVEQYWRKSNCSPLQQ